MQDKDMPMSCHALYFNRDNTRGGCLVGLKTVFMPPLPFWVQINTFYGNNIKMKFPRISLFAGIRFYELSHG